jgi:hypothetical protein
LPKRCRIAAIKAASSMFRDRLADVITTPTLRLGGGILSAPGYDQATGRLLLDLPAMPIIRTAHPTGRRGENNRETG